MSALLNCPHCKKPLSVNDSLQSKKIRCPHCKGIFVTDFVQTAPPPEVDRGQVMELAKNFKWLLWVAFFSLPLAFSYLKFQGVDFVRMGHHLEADLILKIAMAIYYFSWCAGAKFETEGMETLYADAPNKGRIPLAGIGAIAVLVLVGGILCYVDSHTWVGLILAGFWVVNLLMWMYLGSVVKQSVDKSIVIYQEIKNYSTLEKLVVFNELNQGTWQWWRYAVGGVMLAVINLVAFTPLADIVYEAAGGLPPGVILSLSIMAFILSMESWMWYVRIRTLNRFAIIEYLWQKYNWLPKPDTQVKPPPMIVVTTPIAR